MKKLRCQLNTASSIILYGKTICISTLHAFKREDLWPGTTSGSLIGQLYAFLMAFWTESPFNGIKLLFFLFEVVNVCKDRAYEDDKHK